MSPKCSSIRLAFIATCLLLSCVFAAVDAGSKCYVCTSSNAVQIFSTDDNETVEEKEVYRGLTLQQFYKGTACGVDFDAQKDSIEQVDCPRDCVKIDSEVIVMSPKGKKLGKEHFVTRQCSYAMPDERYDDQTIRRSSTAESCSNVMSTCSTDLCNTAARTSPTVLTLIAAILAISIRMRS